MLFAMQPVLRVCDPIRWAKIAVLSAGMMLPALYATPAQGQNTDSGGISTQNSAPVQITPAPSNPMGNTPLEPIFPQSGAPQAGTSGSRSAIYATPNGGSSSAGLGFGPIRPGDIVEIQIFEAPEYSVRMPVSSP